MSTMRNFVQRRNHKERAQPKEREKWGVLEKHKDYSLRAKDYNEKKNRLKILRQKATDRNPDEFNYGMLSQRADRGVKSGNRGNTSLSNGAVKLLKTQDSGYLQTAIQQTTKEIERLEQEFTLMQGEHAEVLGRALGVDTPPEHVIFVNSQEEQNIFEHQVERRRRPSSPPAQREEIESHQASPEILPQPTIKNRRQIEREVLAEREMKKLQKMHRKEQNARRAKLAALRVREKEMRVAENELGLQRAKMSHTVGGITKNGKKWRIRERKK